MAEEETNEIPIAPAHRLGKIREDNKPRPIIAKFSFHKDKERILSSACTLAGTNYGISQDFPREIVEIRKDLVKVMKEAKKKGQDTKLVYDKLYIDGRRWLPVISPPGRFATNQLATKRSHLATKETEFYFV